MFQGGSAPGGLLNPVSAFATGVAEGVDGKAHQGAVANSDDILKATNTKLGDDAARYMGEALRASGYQVGSEGADGRFVIVLERLGYACDGLLMDGACKPRIDATFTLEDVRSGKRLFNASCHYGIQSSVLPCSLDAESGLGFVRIADILSRPDKASANLREAVRKLTNHVAAQMTR